MKPTSPDDYLQQTEHAVRHFCDGLASCWSYYESALQHWDVSNIGQPLTPERKADLDKYLELAGKYVDLKFAEGTFAGSVLQVATVGIRFFSQNRSIPKSCVGIVPTKAKRAIPFCVGRELYGLPVGLIIYAARNQYNHWDDEPYAVTRNVFAALSRSFERDMLYDLAFDVGNPSITVYANEVLLGALGWIRYDQYELEMRALLSLAADA